MVYIFDLFNFQNGKDVGGYDKEMEDRIKALHIGGDKQNMIIKHIKMRTAESEKRYETI